MRRGHLGAWIAVALGGLYFLAPLVATFEFSLRMRRGVYSFDAYRTVFASGNFQAAFLYSTIVALVTIVLAVLIVVPAAYFVQLRLPRLRGIVEFVTLLPLVIPAIVLVFGFIRLYGSSSFLPLTATSLGSDALLTFGYVGLGLPYMYRSVDAGLRAIDVRTLTEAAESQGAGAVTILFQVILPNIRSGVLSGAFLTFAIVIGEFTFASLLDRPAFGPYLQLIGASRAYEPAALAVMAFALHLGLPRPYPARRRRAYGGEAIGRIQDDCGTLVQRDLGYQVSDSNQQGPPMSFLALSGVRKILRRRGCGPGLQPRGRARRARHLPRAQRLRQDDHFAHDRRLRDADRGDDPDRWPRRHPSQGQPPGDRHGVSGLRALSQYDGRSATSPSA